MSSAARAAILARVRAALADVPADEPTGSAPRAPVAAGSPAHAGGLAERFAERVEEYRATVTRCEAGAVADAVAAICRRHAARHVAVPSQLPSAWLPDVVTVLRDDPPLSLGALERVDGVLTGAALGIAQTGTIALDGGARSGRRALTLVPDLHICVVRSRDLVAGVPEAMAGLADAVAAGRPITLVSGPSATSDIELDRIEGVHGPRRLEVVLAGE
jgi:L-lactate dehydrogenase complex protein LldG